MNDSMNGSVDGGTRDAARAAVEDARAFIRALALDAGAILMRHFRTTLETEAKIGNDIVTRADMESEAYVAGRISRRFPEHAIVAEEGSTGAPESDFCWYIDPLDGTVNFAAGVPVFAVSIALAHRSDSLLAVILDPTRRQLFRAEREAGAWVENLPEDLGLPVEPAPLRVSDTDRLSDSLVYLSGFSLRRASLAPPLLRTLERLGPRTRNIINLGSAGIAWAYTAAGHIDGDIAYAVDQYTGPAGVLLVREAGGMVTDFDGVDWRPGTARAVSSNGRIHSLLLEQIEPAVTETDRSSDRR